MRKNSDMKDNDRITSDFHCFLMRSVPRILTQIDRDSDSPTFGCFDRDYWHYKIRDFSSIVLQQGMLVLDALHDCGHVDNPLHNHPLAKKMIDASLSFWASQQLANGSFNEYYPFEEGYPPTAFSLYGVALVFRKRGFPKPDENLQIAIQKGCDWLLDHPEKRALNQESAGLAALALSSRIPDILIDASRLEKRLSVFFNSQSPEGWFPEYGGPDLGYLSVTLDCLWDYFETTGDQRAMFAMNRAVVFMSHFIQASGSTPVMSNARNTGYIVPYGLIRLGASNPLAARIVRAVFEAVQLPSHFLSATDDRYACHYIYQSCFRGLQHLSLMSIEVSPLPCEDKGDFFFEEAGIYCRYRPGHYSIYVAGKKGGVFYLYNSEGCAAADYGWRYRLDRGKVAVTHWQGSSAITVPAKSGTGENVVVEGLFTLHGWHTSTPLRHIVLRLAAFLAGNRLISLLKETMIFKALYSGVRYRRELSFGDDELVITDTFSGSRLGGVMAEPAPHYSMRHVASAGSFTQEELLPLLPARLVERNDNSIVFEKRLKYEKISCV